MTRRIFTQGEDENKMDDVNISSFNSQINQQNKSCVGYWQIYSQMVLERYNQREPIWKIVSIDNRFASPMNLKMFKENFKNETLNSLQSLQILP